MLTYKSSDLTNNKRAEVFREAEANGVIIQQCRTNGEVISEFVLLSVDSKGWVTEGDVMFHKGDL